MIPAIFLDKDGTIVDNSGYPEIIPSDEILKQAMEGLKYLQERGFMLIIISNQPWISKSKLTKEKVEDIFQSVKTKLEKLGITITDYFYCPHQHSDNCDCKKPKPGLILKAREKYNIDLEKSYIVGDMDSDILLGKNLNIKTILVKTGRGKDFLDTNPDFIIENLNSVKSIL
jgi:D,D-heptose 1,7-bisphosphate phosphatase